MFMALCPGTALLSTGQYSTHKLHPVQSSTETCNVYASLVLSNSLPMGSVCLNEDGAPTSSSLPYTLHLIAACGHMRKHLPHCEQRSASHTGTLSAILRFSHLVVATG